MNTYSETFQNITQAVEQLLTNEHNSLEIKQSATNLRESVQPCIQELKQSATRLKGLVQVGFDDLRHAEDVWNSKPRIAEAAKQEIWEQIGEVSGCSFRISRLRSKIKIQTVELAKKSWDQRIERLRKKWFIDARSGNTRDVNPLNKDKLIQEIRKELDWQIKELSSILNESLEVIFQETKAIQLETVRYYVNFLDQRTKAELVVQINLILSKLTAKFDNVTIHISGKSNEFIVPANTALDNLIKQGLFGINGEQFSKFSSRVHSTIEKIIVSAFDDRVELVNKAIMQALSFYNDFLERQERYQQETPEQRMAEKAWIAQQWRELARVHNGIEAILNQSAE